MHLTWRSCWRATLRSAVSAASVPTLIGLIGAGSAAFSPSAFADDPLAELKERINRLEQDNQDLRSSLSQQRLSSSSAPDPLISMVPPPPEESVEESEEEKRVGSIVQKYLRRINAMPSSEDSLQDKKIADLENELGGVRNKICDPKTAIGSFGNDGLFFTSNNGDFKFHMGGVVQMDYICMGGEASGINNQNNYSQENSVSFRRLRWRAEGQMYKNIEYVFEFDFALALQNNNVGINNNLTSGAKDSVTGNPITFPNAGSTSNGANPMNGQQSTTDHGGNGIQGGNTNNVMQPTTIFVTFKDVPVLGNVRVGNQPDWFSMEHIESARFQDMMERTVLGDAFSLPNNNGYTPGASFFNSTPDKNATLQAGIYKSTYYDGGYTFNYGNDFTYGARGIWTPYYDEETKGRYMVHTGFGTQYRQFNDNLNSATGLTNVRVRSRGNLRNAASTLNPNYADTGNFFADGQFLVCPELVAQYGPLLLRSEYIASWFQGARPYETSHTKLNDVFMWGTYAEALYFLTGENRDYNRQSGVFNRVIPTHNADFSKGQYGAWQIGVRYDYLTLNTPQINGGRTQNTTLGLNWFLNPNLRFQVNYVFSYIDNYVGTAGNKGNIPDLGNGALVGSKFTGEGLIQSLGTRIDWTF
jgi:phosphate-selective porin OprO and OprP